MRIRISPTLLEELRKVRVGIWEVSEDHIVNRFLSSRKKSDSYQAMRVRALKHLVQIGREKAMEYCWALGARELYHRQYSLDQVEHNPFAFYYRVLDKQSGAYVNVSTITAFKCFRISEKWRYLFWDLYCSNKGHLIEIDGLKLEIVTKVDAIQSLSTFFFESTVMEPIFFNFWERIDWKITGLLLPELQIANFSVFHFPKGKSTSGCKDFFYPMYYDDTIKADAVAELEIFVQWVKDNPMLLEKLKVKVKEVSKELFY